MSDLTVSEILQYCNYYKTCLKTHSELEVSVKLMKVCKDETW